MFNVNFASRSAVTKGVATRFGPYLLLQALPWLLLATVLRLYVKVAPAMLALPLFVVVQLSVFIGFLVACEKMITIAGGETSLANLTMRQQVRFAWQVVWRLLTVFLLTVLFVVLAGANKMAAALLWFGFDGLAFPWRQGALQIWVAFIAIVAFLLVLEKANGNEPRFLGVAKQLVTHRRILFFSWIYLGLSLLAITFIQSKLALILGLLLDNQQAGTIGTYLFVGYIVLFSCLRIWIIVAILTYAMRASYRRTGRENL